MCYVTKTLDTTELHNYVNDIRQAVRFAVADLKYHQHQNSDLMPCTEFSLRIIPSFSGIEVIAGQYDFKTLTPSGQFLSVTGLQANSLHNGTTVLSWEGLQCATSYEISRNGEN